LDLVQGERMRCDCAANARHCCLRLVPTAAASAPFIDGFAPPSRTLIALPKGLESGRSASSNPRAFHVELLQCALWRTWHGFIQAARTLARNLST
jgi:hypothetical protein